MNTKRNSDQFTKWLSDNIIIVYIIFIVLIVVAPYTLSFFPILGLDSANEIGDAINGITAPIIGSFSALLVYLAFKGKSIQRANFSAISTLLITLLTADKTIVHRPSSVVRRQ